MTIPTRQQPKGILILYTAELKHSQHSDAPMLATLMHSKPVLPTEDILVWKSFCKVPFVSSVFLVQNITVLGFFIYIYRLAQLEKYKLQLGLAISFFL